jgi:NitT/TauT family transport system substrate-binding protein
LRIFPSRHDHDGKDRDLRTSCLVAGFAALLATAANAADRVTIQLDYVLRGSHAMFFLADQKGYFTDQGIELAAVRTGTSSSDALRSVGTGSADFGFADFPTLAVSREQGIPAVALVAVNQTSPLAMIALAKRKVLASPKDLQGLTIGVQPAGSTYVFLKAFLAANGMSLEDIREHAVQPPYENDLLSGKVDAVPGYIDAEVPVLEAKSGGHGTLSILLGSNFGYTVFGSGLFTSEKMIAERGDLVRRFVKAYVKAFADVIANPQEGADSIVRANPDAPPKAILVKQLEADLEHSFLSEETKAHGIGWMADRQWKETAKVLADEGVLNKPTAIDTAFDASFLKSAEPPKR